MVLHGKEILLKLESIRVDIFMIANIIRGTTEHVSSISLDFIYFSTQGYFGHACGLQKALISLSSKLKKKKLLIEVPQINSHLCFNSTTTTINF